ncbi:Ig-like domain-containing protein [Vibrio chagasii]|uniref:Ig-like domain-containing protein n=1 Tax=Vibrio chagasii TaxID=170679 RepID=UPI0038CD3D29
MFNRQLISAIAMIVGLSGCGSDSDTAVSTPLVLSDGFVTVVPEQNSFVNLRPFVLAGASAELELTDISLVSGSDSGCSDSPVVSELGLLGFDTVLNGSAICQYTYTVVSATLGSDKVVEKTASINVMATTSENPLLQPISVAFDFIGPVKETVRIDNALQSVGVTWPSGYTLSDNVTLFGEGAVSSDATTRTITFTPNKVGSNRIVYRLVDNEGSAHKYGTIEISVFERDGDTNAPIASDHGEWKDEVKLDTLTDIDIAEFIESPDGHALHLIDVNAFAADVNIKATESSDNTVFTFMSNVPGDHYVSYVVADNNGQFDSGVVKVIVEERNIKASWGDDLAGGLVFNAPLTKFESDTIDAGATAGFFDGVNTPAVLISHWTFDEAKAYCHLPMHLPSKEELDTLKLNSIRHEVAKWPKDSAYWTEDGGLYNLNSDGGVATRTLSSVYETRGYVTCANSVGSLEITTSNSEEVIADGEDTGVIEARVINPEGEAYPGIAIQVASVSGEGIVTSDAEQVTDENGIVTFFVTSLEAGTQQFVIRVEDAGVKKTADITFRKEITDIRLPTSVNYMLVDDVEKLSATEVYGDSTTSPLINGNWTLTSSPSGIDFTLTKEGTFFSGVSGSFGVTVDKDGVTSNELPIRVCETTAEACIDVVDVNNGKLYTGSPSVPWLDSVGLAHLADGWEHPFSTSSGNWYGPVDSEFYIFKWNSAFGLCLAYNDIALEGRTNWRLPSLDELRTELLGEVEDRVEVEGGLKEGGRDMYDDRTWPTWSQYWTTTYAGTVDGGADDGANLYFIIGTDLDHVINDAPKWNSLYVSCTSEPM